MNPDEILAMEGAVVDGAAFMDAIDPEWFWSVDPNRLDMFGIGPECGCVLAQHRGGVYWPSGYGLEDPREAVALGFTTMDSGLAAWRRLTRLWQEAIQERRWEALP